MQCFPCIVFISNMYRQWCIKNHYRDHRFVFQYSSHFHLRWHLNSPSLNIAVISKVWSRSRETTCNDMQFEFHSFENQLDKEIQLVGFFLKPPTCFPIARLINSILSEHQTTRDENHESSHVSSWRMLRNAQHLYACWLTSFTFDSNYRWTAVPIILCICAFPHNLYSFEKASFYISFLSNKRIQKKNIESDIFLW